MTTEKFVSEVETLKSFWTTYCLDKHSNQNAYNRVLSYNDEIIKVKLQLCNNCADLLDYAFDRLIECPYDKKPRCRKCPKPCYEKTYWKKVAKLMMYSGMKLGFTRIRDFAKTIFRGVHNN